MTLKGAFNMACDPKLINRLKRTEGQIRGIQAMIEEERDCSEIITQLSAVESSVKKVMGIIVTENIKNKLSDEEGEELMESLKLIDKLK
jgi:DNA-binding FrmR family transcriptional regulator